MKFLMEVITTDFKFSSPTYGREGLKSWSGVGREGKRVEDTCGVYQEPV